MNNDLQEHKKSDTVKWILTLIAFILVGVLLLGIILGWFEKKEPTKEAQPSAEQTGGMRVEVNEENGIKMMSAVIPFSEFDDYGISPQAETAYTLTATVSPNNEATNTAVKWSIAWKNASSTWATEKAVTNYVTLEWNDADYVTSKTVTVSCLKAFAEPIEVKAVTAENPAYSATVSVDYALRLGSNPYLKTSGGKKALTPVWDGDTKVTLEVASGQRGTGGKIALDLFAVTQDYTVGDTFTVTLSLKNGGTICGGVAAGSPGGSSYGIRYVSEAVISQKSITITPGGSYICSIADLGSLELCNDALFSKYNFAYYSGSAFGGSTTTELTTVSANTVFGYFSYSTDGSLNNGTQKLWDLVLSVEGTYSSYEWTTALMVTHVTNSTTINGLSVADTAITF